MKRSRPLLLLVVFGLSFFGWLWLPDPVWLQAAEGARSAWTIDALWALIGPGVPVLLIGLFAAWGAGGATSLRCAGSFLLGCEREGEHLHAHHALRAAARAMVSAGLVLGLLAGTAMFLLAGQSPETSPANFAYVIQWSLLTPITALGVGRLVLGVAADGAALRAGVPERRAFASRDDLLLLLYLLPPVMTFSVVVWPITKIQ